MSSRPLSSYSTIGPKERRGVFLFDKALEELDKQLQGKPGVILELGGIRDKRAAAREADGWSTVRWCASRHQVWSIDLSRKAVEVTRSLVGSRGFVVQSDGVEWLSKFIIPIDLLYLDGPDGTDAGKQFSVNAFNVAVERDLLPPGALVLIDDCDFDDLGKAGWLLPRMIDAGWELVADNVRQKLLRRPTE